MEELAELLEKAGIERVTGRVFGDESRFDARRGGPESGFRISPYVGPLSDSPTTAASPPRAAAATRPIPRRSRPRGSTRRWQSATSR